MWIADPPQSGSLLLPLLSTIRRIVVPYATGGIILCHRSPTSRMGSMVIDGHMAGSILNQQLVIVQVGNVGFGLSAQVCGFTNE